MILGLIIGLVIGFLVGAIVTTIFLLKRVGLMSHVSDIFPDH